MSDTLPARVAAVVAATRPRFTVGRVAGTEGGTVQVSGLAKTARLGDRIGFLADPALSGEVIGLSGDLIRVLTEGSHEGLRAGDPVRLDRPRPFAPGWHWIGRVVDPEGRPLDSRPLLPGGRSVPLSAPPPAPHRRRPMGARLGTGLAVFDTLLPLARGQRLGLFAGSGVGKSTLLGTLAREVEADVIVIGLVGERGRELRDFVETVLGPEGMARAVVVTATSDRSPQQRRRCAPAAMAVAEWFRDQGREVLLLLDSVTRFAEAHREISVARGEPAALRGYPASTGPAIAALCERAGPGEDGQGDITAVFSVLVAGSDMDEPVADMLRGVLDGHVVLDREIAERGRFPAVNMLRSVSRSLPGVATFAENEMIAQARKMLGTYERAELMIQSGLYSAGTDPQIDAAVACWPDLDAFLARRSPRGIADSFAALRRALPEMRQRRVNSHAEPRQ